jgi:mannan endo-1,4-beta-mannosidase
MARDAWRRPQDSAYKYAPSTPTSHKDIYFKGLFDQIEQLDLYSGSNFWAYGGLGRSTDDPNKYNMTWLGGKWKSCLEITLFFYFYFCCINISSI